MAKDAKHKDISAEDSDKGTIIHLVFEAAGAEVLAQSFELEAHFAGEVLVLQEDYAVGPVENIFLPEGWQLRKEWWQQVLSLASESTVSSMAGDKMKLHRLTKELEEDRQKQLWLWMGQNARDVCGYYWLVSQLTSFQGQVYILYLNNLPFINERGSIFYPTHLSQILPKEFVKAARLARVITLSEFELDPDEWKKLCEENAALRILDGGKKIISRPAENFDKEILAALGSGAMKLPKLMAALSGKAKIDVEEDFIIWRIRKMTEAGLLTVQGDWEKGNKNIVLKNTGGLLFVEIEEPETDATGEQESA